MSDESSNPEPTRAGLGGLRLGYFTPVREYPPLADRKSTILLASIGLMITVVFMFYEPMRRIVEGEDDVISDILILALLVLAGVLIVSLRHALVCLTMPIPPMPTSLAMFSHIAELSLDDYRAAMLRGTHETHLRDMLTYNHTLAVLSVAKFRHVNVSIKYLRAGFYIWLAILAMVAFSDR